MGPRFYGFPFVQQTNLSWGGTMSGEIYLLGILGNILFWALIFRGLGYLFDLMKNKIIQKALLFFRWAVLVFSLFIVFMYYTVIDLRYKLSHDNFKMNYYEKDIDCEREHFSEFVI